ncbi:aldose 1-epimerase family protein [Pseudooceanicola sediminis]|uniref:Aldose 1-epimerase family protein n=1 Tax=Pseudooceanicola sediminis TaxID=2211117 RepID=A0A399IZ83_9RHOB|nr:aldose 1-epimerase family protein [Pseudooceanicola sediminis]KAA2313343.1 aldose 1-epimerase family protein [Puniceibacterium sp. HSS470]RII38375.1 aldose 1-epimerase family protein [Pseudooceanicola sediminis]|tara:strand:- start:58614 stop:59486 length:873 start_codon:yes stop_codon:yes gene_type:complete
MPTETTITSPDLSVTLSDLGAELQSITTAAGDALLWHGDPAFWGGRAPILFPIVGRGPNDRIAVNGQEAAMRQHGFARHSTFQLVEVTPDRCVYALNDSAESRAVYPFAFRLTLTYHLIGPTLSVTAEVTNASETAMPFGLGFHPAFAWPLPGAGKAAHRITLANGAEPALARLVDGHLAPERSASPFDAGVLPLHPDLFDADALIFPGGAGDALSYRAPDSAAPALHFTFSNTPNLGIWSKPGAPFVCIEPWHGMAARTGDGPEIADRPHTTILAPGKTASFGYALRVE